MSVLIKTMKNLPEHCYDCPCHDGESGYCQADEEHRYSDYRPFWCPLVEVREEQQPCGDTISRKAVRDTIFAECSGTKLDIDFAKVLLLQRAIKSLPPVMPQDIKSIPFLMHKELEIPISECQKAYKIAIDYLRSQANVRG